MPFQRSRALLVFLLLAPFGAAASPHRPRAKRPLPPVEREAPIEGSAGRGAREAWALRQRALPAASIPEGAYAAAARAWTARTLPAKARGIPRTAADTINLWRELGPAPLAPPPETPNSGQLSGRLRAIAVHPTDPKTIYVGAAQGGVWKTTDGGVHFLPLTDAQPSLAMGAIAIDPRAPDTIYAGTGENNFGYYGQGLLKSTDGGKSWSRPAGAMFAGASTSKIVIDGKTGVLYVGTSAGSQGAGDGCTAYYVDQKQLGLWRSSDGGSSFSRLVEGGVTDFEIDTTVDPRQLFVTVSGVGAFALTEGGAMTPLALPNAQSNPPGNEIELALAPSNPKVVYAGMAVGDPRQPVATLFVSQDHGASWAQVPGTPNYCYSQCGYTNAVEVHPTKPGTVYLAGGLCSVWKTNNALSPSAMFRAVSMPDGYCAPRFANWYQHYVHPDGHAIAFLPGDGEALLVATDGGLSKTSDGGASWIDLNQQLGTMQFYGICVDPDDPEHVYGGAQDNGSMERGGSPASWSGLIEGDGGPCVAAAKSGGLSHHVISDIYASVMIPGPQGYVTTFDADPSACMGGDPGCGDRAAFIAPLIADPSDASVLYVGTYRLFRSNEGGAADSWKAVSGDLTVGPGGVHCTNGAASEDYLTAIAVAPSAGMTVYTGSAGGRVSRTSDGGATWTSISTGKLPSRWVSAIGVDPASPDSVWVAFSGFDSSTPNHPGHVFHSDDGGGSWVLRDIGMDMPVNALLVRPDDGEVVFAGTDFGVLATVDAGATWTPMNGLPNVTVYSLQLHAKSGTLYAGTHGRGAWARALVPSLSVTPPSLSFTAAAGTMSAVPQSATLKVANGDPSGGVLRFTVVSSESWLTADPASSHTASAAGVAITATAMPPSAIGEYDATLTVADPNSSNHSVDIPVHYSVTKATGCGCHLGGGSAPPSGATWIALLSCALIAWRRRAWRRVR